jgi:hypothetical protein
MISDRKRRRWFRVSLRALMLSVLAVAVFLGYEVNKAKRQRAAVEAVKKAGGSVHYDYEFANGKLTPGREPEGPRWLRGLLGDEYFQHIEQVDLLYDDSSGKWDFNKEDRPCDAVLALLRGMAGLKTLFLKGGQATDEGLRHIGTLRGLEDLVIIDAWGVTDDGVAHLSGLRNLKSVCINRSVITDESLVLLSRLPQMETISLSGPDFTDSGLTRLEGADRLKVLRIGHGVGHGTRRVTDAGLARLKAFRKLETLDVPGAFLTADGLDALKSLPNLKELWVAGTRER